ncbi:1,4-alpha-glucan branching protein GlgB [uncultured Clostridium sp.]|uniref:1,4-alpha-glucan branching protein GlgB n=1 Tax=uncultured Clostridium sp. TaxID=59620 RepID=UPI00261BDD96|nr:1,4-alpha-glucan branching protein GlgB [uncultured Clostridium sp.]
MITEYNKYLFHEGNHILAYEFMGAHIKVEEKKRGVRFTVWAPKASEVYVVGDFSDWEIREEFLLGKITDRGIYSNFIKGVSKGAKYKFAIRKQDGEFVLKADPYARKSELRPDTASIVTSKSSYKWTDRKWWRRKKENIYKKPMNIYEIHLGSWKKDENGGFLKYEELAKILPSYLKEMNYTHVEIMPLMEYPLDESWGYQITGYYSPTSRYGDEDGLKMLINELHKAGIGVLLDWVPGHFCKDEHGLAYFDGCATYEYEEGWKAQNKGWGTLNFDLGKPEVKSFLISNAIYWLKEFHIDGLRVDAVTNMLYLDYDRKHGEWFANSDGTNINYYGVDFFKELNSILLDKFKNVILCAEESTTFNKISHKIEDGGLGFHFKWNMGWMNDTLEYVEADPIYRKYKHNNMNFAMMYNYSEHFVLPISHDEVVHGKKSLVNKMWGDYFNKFAGFRAYMTYMIGHPGKKLLFMGSEFAQFIEWREYEELEWSLLENHEMHRQTKKFVSELNKFYLDNKELWEKDHEVDGFQWIDADNGDQSIYSFVRKGENEENFIFILNFTPNYYESYKVGVPNDANYVEAFNTDRLEYGGSGKVMDRDIVVKEEVHHKSNFTVEVTIPPMGAIVLKGKKGEK